MIRKRSALLSFVTGYELEAFSGLRITRPSSWAASWETGGQSLELVHSQFQTRGLFISFKIMQHCTVVTYSNIHST